MSESHLRNYQESGVLTDANAPTNSLRVLLAPQQKDSSRKFMSVQTCRDLALRKEEEGGDRRTSPQGRTAAQTNNPATSLVLWCAGTRPKPWRFSLRGKQGQPTQLTGFTAASAQSRQANLEQFTQLPNVQPLGLSATNTGQLQNKHSC